MFNEREIEILMKLVESASVQGVENMISMVTIAEKLQDAIHKIRESEVDDNE